MKRALVPWGGLSVPVRIRRADVATTEGTLLSEEIWNVCRDAALSLPRQLRVELHTQPGEPRVAADADAVRREFAALLQRAAALLRSRAGVLVVGVLVTAPDAATVVDSGSAWIAVRLFGEERALNDDLIGGEVGGPRHSKGGRPFRTESLGPPHLAPGGLPASAGAARFRQAAAE